MPTFPAPVLERATAAVFLESGVPEATARVVASHLVEAELCGVVSHGVIRIPQYVEALETGDVRVDAELTVLSERPGCCALDGGGGFGPMMARGAMERAIAKARENGVGAATLVNTGHTGRLASYALQAADAGMVGVVLVNAGGNGQWVAPFGGRAGRLSTNPMAFAIPRQDAFPIVLDIATSVVPEGKVRALKAGGDELPGGWVIDSDGEPTTDPADLYGPPRGAILPAGGHKGYGLAFVVDLLAGALSGAGVCYREDAPLGGETDGVFLLAVDVGSFLPLERFAEMADSLVDHVTSCPPAPGFDAVRVPGEFEALRRREGLARGIKIDDGRWSSIAATFERLGVAIESQER